VTEPALADVRLPTADEEVWRYSRIAELDLEDFELLTARAATAEVPEPVAHLLGALPEWAGVVVVRNGSVVHAELAEGWAAKGVWFGAQADAPDISGAGDQEARQPTDVFAELNARLAIDPVLLRVPGGVSIAEPFVVIDWVDHDSAMVFPRLVVDIGPDADARVLEWQGSTDVHALVAPVVDLRVGQAARLGYLNVQERGPRVWQITSQVSAVERDATLIAAQAAFGGDYARCRADCRLVGRGATGNLLAAFFGKGSQTLDFRTFQDHAAPDTTSNLLFKGAVDDHSRSIYTGLIRVRKEARGTNAFQTNRNVKLSEFAWAESVPNLEIENNDVHCSHASTVGPVDAEQLFYLESRGIPPEVGERLIVGGFFDEVVQQIPVGGVAELLELQIDRRLGQGERL
jgi:Fe-S cluster assembly protein SufD